MSRLNTLGVFVSRRMRLLVMAAVVIGCLKMGLNPAPALMQDGAPGSSAVHAGVDITRPENAERTQGPDKSRP